MADPPTPPDDSAATPFLLQFAERLRPARSAPAPAVDLVGLLQGLLPELPGVRELRPEVLLLAHAPDIDAPLLEAELTVRGVSYLRLNVEDLPEQARLCWHFDGRGAPEARLSAGARSTALAGFRAVWYHLGRFEVVPRGVRKGADRAFAGREWQAALPGLWRSSGGVWLNPPEAAATASDKLTQLRHAAALGFAVPRTLVTNDPAAVADFYAACEGEILAKPLHTHSLRRGRRRVGIFGRRLGPEDLSRLPALVHAPCIFQEYIEKRIEVRVTVVGERLFAAEIHSQQNERARTDFRRAVGEVPIDPHALPPALAARCRRLVADLGLGYAALDLILTPDDRYIFLEANERGSWRWVEQRSGLPITAAVADYLLSPPR